MEFGKHIGKGLWAFADKALPAMYGIGFIFLVMRVMPEKEYGSFAVIQSIFLIVSALGFSLAFQPLTKFAAETRDNGEYIVAALILVTTFFALVSVVVVALRGMFASLLDPTGVANLEILLNYLPLLLATTLYRNFAMSLLQSTYDVKKIFWIDAVYFLGTLLLFFVARKVQRFDTAEDIIRMNAFGLTLSSLLSFFLVSNRMKVKLSLRREAFLKMWNFGKYNIGSNANYLVYSQMDVFLVSRYAGVVMLAFYSAAKIITRIYDLLAQVLQMFIMPMASKLYAQGEREKLTVVIEKSISFSALILLPVILMLMLLPHWCIHIIYSGKYDSAAGIMQVFGILALVVPWNSVFAAALVGIGRVRLGFYLGFVVTAVFLLLSWLLVKPIGAIGVAIALVASNIVTVVALSHYTKKYIGYSITNVIARVKDAWVFFREGFISYIKLSE